MTQVELDGTWFYVTSVTASVEPLGCELRQLSPARALYRVKDGHLRLHIHQMGGDA